MSTRIDLRFATSADRLDQLPDSSAEVAFAGRSNVGKSSLINALAGTNNLARTSKTPGRTRLLNCFVTPSGATVVDLPGYGYAKVSRTERDRWERRLTAYLTSREALVRAVLLVDAEVGPTSLDLAMLELVRGEDVPHAIVATKHDKVRSSHRTRRRRELAAGCGVAESEVLWTSVATGVNIDELRRRVSSWLEVRA